MMLASQVNLLLGFFLLLPHINTFLYKTPIHVYHRVQRKGAIDSQANLYRAKQSIRLHSTSDPTRNLIETTKILFRDASSKAITIESIEKLTNSTVLCKESIAKLTDTKVLLKSFESLVKQFFTTQLDPIQLRTFEQVSESFLSALMQSYDPEKLETDMFDDLMDLFLECVDHIHKSIHSNEVSPQHVDLIAFQFACAIQQFYSTFVDKISINYMLDSGVRNAKIQEFVGPIFARLQRRFPRFSNEEASESLLLYSKVLYRKYLQELPLQINPPYSLERTVHNDKVGAYLNTFEYTNNGLQIEVPFPEGELTLLVDRILRYISTPTDLSSLNYAMTQTYHDSLVRKTHELLNSARGLLQNTGTSTVDILESRLTHLSAYEQYQQTYVLLESPEMKQFIENSINLGHLAVMHGLSLWQIRQNIIGSLATDNPMNRKEEEETKERDEAKWEDEAKNHLPMSYKDIPVTPAELLQQAFEKRQREFVQKKENPLQNFVSPLTSLQPMVKEDMLECVPFTYHNKIIHDEDFYNRVYAKPPLPSTPEHYALLLPGNNTIWYPMPSTARGIALLAYSMHSMIDTHYHAISLYNMPADDSPISVRQAIFQHVLSKVFVKAMLSYESNEIEFGSHLIAVKALEEMLCVEEMLFSYLIAYKQALYTVITQWEKQLHVKSSLEVSTPNKLAQQVRTLQQRMQLIDRIFGIYFKIMDPIVFVKAKQEVLESFVDQKLRVYLGMDNSMEGDGDSYGEETTYEQVIPPLISTMNTIANIFQFNASYFHDRINQKLQNYAIQEIETVLLKKDYHVLLQFAALSHQEELLDNNFMDKMNELSTQIAQPVENIANLGQDISFHITTVCFELLIDQVISMKGKGSMVTTDDEALVEQYWKQIYFVFTHPFLTTARKVLAKTTTTDDDSQSVNVKFQSIEKNADVGSPWLTEKLSIGFFPNLSNDVQMILMKCIDYMKKVNAHNEEDLKSRDQDTWGLVSEKDASLRRLQGSEDSSDEGIDKKRFDSMLSVFQRLTFTSYTAATSNTRVPGTKRKR